MAATRDAASTVADNDITVDTKAKADAATDDVSDTAEKAAKIKGNAQDAKESKEGKNGKGRDKKKSGPTFLEKQRAQRPWFDHLMRAVERFNEQHGPFYAGGITYYSVLSVFPLLMIAFAIFGLVLAGNPELMEEVKGQIQSATPGEMGETLKEIVDVAVEQGSAVGVIGLLTALYSGTGWMGNLRKGLTAQWVQQPEPKNFFITRAVDLLALAGLALAFALSFGISAVGSGGVLRSILQWLHLDGVPGAGLGIKVVTIVVSILATWLVFAWIIAYLPRERADLGSALRAALFAAVIFEVWKQIGSFYLQSVMSSPAGATFGPIIGIMVFFFYTWQILLFATAWAATSKRSLELAPATVPDPAIIRPRMVTYSSPAPKVTGGLLAAGAALGIAFLALLGWKPRHRR